MTTTPHQTILRLIETRFSAMFTACSVAYENVPFVPGVLPWVRLTVIFGGARTIEIGGNASRFVGVISVQVFTPSGDGTRGAAAIADAVVGVFKNATFGGVVCRTPSIQNIGQRDGWYQVNVNVNFYFNDFN